MSQPQRRNLKSRASSTHAEMRTQGLSIEIVAARAGVTVRRVQYLEREGLIWPATEESSQRLYNEQAIERIQLIERLMVDLGVNLPGAEVILNMRERMLTLLDEIDRTR